ncbi:hypothetical protein ADICEAN_01400 [Cesiribacter andamanensis AMV16]|uniref:Uncharacterized protein n=1 Tax=Cesiribacter andamanensis AMV16 TaxID=1279009 RepID=M7N878_9BACT|nr:hypothetical protein ADICEAN_01400 [Cesiribacter andamanensis AMV16]
MLRLLRLLDSQESLAKNPVLIPFSLGNHNPLSDYTKVYQ